MPKPKFIQWKISAIWSLMTALWSIMYFHYIWRLPYYTIVFCYFTVYVWPGVLFPSPSSISNFPAQSHVCVWKTKTITTKWRRILTKGRHRQIDKVDKKIGTMANPYGDLGVALPFESYQQQQTSFERGSRRFVMSLESKALTESREQFL